jgi:spermidine/putrescine-binding protein
MTARWTRREFLTASAGVAGATLAGWPARAWGQAKLPSPVRILTIAPFAPFYDRFTQKTGVELVKIPYVSPTDTLQKISAPGGIGITDLATLNAPFVKPLAERNLLLPIDYEKIPNAKTMYPLFEKDKVYKDGKPYAFPHIWGYDTVLYDTSKISKDDPVTQSWKLLFDDRYKGKVALRDDAHQSLIAAAFAMGYKDPVQELNRKELGEVKKFLVAKKKNFRALWTGFAEAVNLMKSDEVWAMYGWIPMRVNLQKEGKPVLNNWPREAVLFWTHVYFVPKGARNLESVYAFLDFIISTDYSLPLTRGTGYMSASGLVETQLSAEEKVTLGYDLPQRGVRLYGLDLPENLNEWSQTWAEFKSA